MSTTPPRRRPWRIPAAALVVAGILSVLSTASPAQAAPWVGTTVRSTTLAMATFGSAFQAAGGTGTPSADNSSYTLSTVLTSASGYVNLVNTSSVPVTLRMTVSMGNLLGSTPATTCSQPWNATTGTCPGTTAPVAITVLAGNSTGTWATAAPVDPTRAVYLKVQTSGVAGAVTLTTAPVGLRTGIDRTTP